MPCGWVVVAVGTGTTEPAVAPARTVSGPRGSSVEMQAAASLRGQWMYELCTVGGERSKGDDLGAIPKMAVRLKQSCCSEQRHSEEAASE
jgi:hypothetical protein